MVSDFPVPRNLLPRLRVTEEEYEARKQQMERVVRQTVEEYERFSGRDRGHTNHARWKHAATKGPISIFRERRSYTKQQQHKSSDDMIYGSLEDMYDEQGSGDGDVDGDLQDVSGETIPGRSLLMTGDLHGKVENALYALMSRSDEEYALTLEFLFEEVADCAVLHVLEEPSPSRPYNFMGYKWGVMKAPMGGRFLKHRDTIYLENTGMTYLSTGEQVGFHIMQHVEHPDFPDMPERNCVRSMQTLRFIYRQTGENVVQVFMLGVMDVSLNNLMRPFASLVTTDRVFRVTRVMECAEAKRLTKMMVKSRRARDGKTLSHHAKSSECSLCHQKKKLFTTVSLVDCSICAQMICSRCRAHRRIYVSDGVVGRFHRIGCCKACVLKANEVPPAVVVQEDPVHLDLAMHLVRQRSSRDLSSGSGTINDMQTRVRRSNSDSSVVSVERSVRSTASSSRSRGSNQDRHRVPEAGQYSTHYQRSATAKTQSLAPLAKNKTEPAPVPATLYSSVPRPQTDLFMQMLELQKAADTAFQTTQQNERMIQHTQRP
ncbi:hypothetical protein Poli38472_007318 [Pythium oligandrum]|uniref:FYVE-type domain-containing protein n=1 Tax=Pythium oligandrum TaxID=41045 RepID=A0A8K1FHW9_PYTOL|nr:hypothetical protein Poli38472_007318 [Pythium oligandrum]|eukprot:TMW59173.1 hypothetical protein Poli38472_007318 [Pythium oligandrum]